MISHSYQVRGSNAVADIRVNDSNNVTVSATIEAQGFIGDGSGLQNVTVSSGAALSNLNASNVTTGTLSQSVMPLIFGNASTLVTAANVSITGDLLLSQATQFLRSDTRFYVSQTRGNDLNHGTSPNFPFKTIKKAVQSANLHTIFVESGNYTEDNPLVMSAGTAIVGDNLRRVIIEPLNKKADILHVSNGCYVAGVRFIKLQSPGFGVSFPRVVAEAFVNSGSVQNSVSVYYSPSGYLSPPSVRIDPPESGVGTAATATAIVTAGHVTGITVTSGGSGYDPSERPQISIAPPSPPFITASPYIQNCSMITGPFTNSGVYVAVGDRTLPYDYSDIDPHGAGGGMLVDGNVLDPLSPLQSMVADAYTQVSQGGIGFLVTNNGYAQLVSCFTTFSSVGVKAAWGGFVNLSNSVSDFGDKALMAVGYWTTPYTSGVSASAYTSTVSSIALSDAGCGYDSPPAVTISGGGGTSAAAQASIDTTIALIQVTNGGSGYVTAPTVVITGTQSTPAIATAAVSGGIVTSVTVIDGGNGYLNSDATVSFSGGGGTSATAVARVGKVTKVTVTNAGSGYTSLPSISIAAPTVRTGSRTATGSTSLAGTGTIALTGVPLDFRGLNRRPDVGSAAQIAGSWYTVTNVVKNATDAFTVSVYPSVPYVAAGSTVSLYHISSISTGSHTMEYVGSGVTYNALPEYGGVPGGIGSQVTAVTPARIYYATVDNVGNSKIGPFFGVEQSTGSVTIDANIAGLTLAGLNAIGPFRRNGVAVGQQLQEVSNDVSLTSADQTTTVPTQYAVTRYIATRAVPAGGNTFQVLSKYSATDGAFQWANIAGDGSALSGLNVSNAATGVLAVARGGTGTTTATGTGSVVLSGTPTFTGNLMGANGISLGLATGGFVSLFQGMNMNTAADPNYPYYGIGANATSLITSLGGYGGIRMFTQTAAPALVVSAGGWVGIGTSTPTSTLSVTGNVSATGNVAGAYIVGNLSGTSAALTGNVSAGNVSTTGNISGAYIFGNGSGLTNLPAATTGTGGSVGSYSGTLATSALGNTTVHRLLTSGTLTITGTGYLRADVCVVSAGGSGVSAAGGYAFYDGGGGAGGSVVKESVMFSPGTYVCVVGSAQSASSISGNVSVYAPGPTGPGTGGSNYYGTQIQPGGASPFVFSGGYENAGGGGGGGGACAAGTNGFMDAYSSRYGGTGGRGTSFLTYVFGGGGGGGGASGGGGGGLGGGGNGGNAAGSAGTANTGGGGGGGGPNSPHSGGAGGSGVIVIHISG